MKKILALFIISLLVIAVSGCPENKFPQGKQVKPADVPAEEKTE